MKCINLSELWDKENSESVELHSIASLIYGDNFQLIFDKYIFGFEKENNRIINGNIFDKDGVVIKTDVEYVAPLIKSVDGKIVAYLIGEKRLESLLGVQSVFKTVLRSSSDFISSMDDISMIFNRKLKVQLIMPDGTMGEARVDSKVIGNRCEYFVEFKDDIYVQVCDKHGIVNHLVCTK